MGWVNNNVIQPVAQAVAPVVTAPVRAVGSVASSTIGTVGNVAGSALGAAANVGQNLGAAVVSPVAGALPTLGSASGQAVSGLLGPGGSNAPALGALVGGALGNPLALGGLDSGAQAGSPLAPDSLLVAPSVGPGMLSQGSSMTPYLIGGAALIGILLLKGKR